MGNEVQFKKWRAILSIAAIFASVTVRAEAPLLRIKAGVTSLNVNAEPRLAGEKLTPMVTFEPSLIWEVPEFSSRLGVHYLQEIGGKFGMTPISGIGVSGYYFINGLSTSYTKLEDGTVIRKSRPGPFMVASLTPINFNLNQFDEQDTGNNFNFSSLLYDLSAGIGYDYPIGQNMIISLEYVLRNGAGTDSRAQSLSYSGSTIFLSFATCYY